MITLIKRYKEMSFPELNFKKVDFLRENFEVGYFVAALVCSGLLVAVVALPFVSTGYGMDRAHLLGTPLSVFFVIGGTILSKQTFKKSLIKNLSLKKKASLKNQKEE